MSDIHGESAGGTDDEMVHCGDVLWEVLLQVLEVTMLPHREPKGLRRYSDSHSIPRARCYRFRMVRLAYASETLTRVI